MRLTDEDVRRHKENKYSVECVKGKVKMSDGDIIGNLCDTIEALQQEYDELDTGHSKLFKDFCEMKQDIEQLQDDIDKLRMSANLLTGRVEQLQAQNGAMRKGQPLFPNKLKEKCEQHGMTLRDVALKAGIAESTVYSLSACKVFPYPAWRQKIAKVFNCKESEIFAEVGE